MKRLSLAGLLFVFAIGFLFLALQSLVEPAHAGFPISPSAARYLANLAKEMNEKEAKEKQAKEEADKNKTTATSAAVNPPDCITDVATAVVSLISDSNARTILIEEMRLTDLKQALEARNDGKKVLEEFVTKPERQLIQADITGVRTKLVEMYNKFGRNEDLATIVANSKNKRYVDKRKDADGKVRPWKARFKNSEASAYLQAKS